MLNWAKKRYMRPPPPPRHFFRAGVVVEGLGGGARVQSPSPTPPQSKFHKCLKNNIIAWGAYFEEKN